MRRKMLLQPTVAINYSHLFNKTRNGALMIFFKWALPCREINLFFLTRRSNNFVGTQFQMITVATFVVNFHLWCSQPISDEVDTFWRQLSRKSLL